MKLPVFRAKLAFDPEDEEQWGEWNDYGDLKIPHDNGWVTGTPMDGIMMNGLIEASQDGVIIQEWMAIRPETIGMRSEWQENNQRDGRYLYHGDIVHYKSKGEDDRYGIVWFNGNEFVIRLDYDSHWDGSYVKLCLKKVTIVDNRFDTPEWQEKYGVRQQITYMGEKL